MRQALSATADAATSSRTPGVCQADPPRDTGRASAGGVGDADGGDGFAVDEGELDDVVSVAVEELGGARDLAAGGAGGVVGFGVGDGGLDEDDAV